MTDEARFPFRRFYPGRFPVLLVSIILTFALSPFLVGFIRIKILTDIFLSAILLSVIQAVSEKKTTFFITMATVGYGDTTPVSSAARSLTLLEAAMGQRYLAVTIARLVGMQISQKQKKQEK
jgi:hypothetical protein